MTEKLNTPITEQQREIGSAHESGRNSLGAAFLGGTGYWAQQVTRVRVPHWWLRMDAVDVLFLGLSLTWRTTDEAAFSAARELWLDQFRASDYWGTFQSFVYQMSDTSDRTELGVNDPVFHFELTHDLATQPTCLEILPTRLQPWPALLGTRSFKGIDLDAQLPTPTRHSTTTRDRLLLGSGLTVKNPTTAVEGLQRGLELLREHSVDDRLLPLAAFFAGVTGRDMTLEQMCSEAFPWVLGLPETTPAAVVADAAVRCIARGMPTGETLARILALPEVYEPINRDTCKWRSEVGLAAIRESFNEVPGRPVITTEGRVFHLSSALKRTLLRIRPDLDKQHIGPPQENSGYIFDEEMRSGRPWQQMLDLMTASGLSRAGSYAAQVTGILPPGTRGFLQHRDVRDWEKAIGDYRSKNLTETYDQEADEQIADLFYLSMMCGVGKNSLESMRATIEDLENQDSMASDIVGRLGPSLIQTLNSDVTQYLNAAREIALATSGARVADGVAEVIEILINDQDLSVDLIPSLYCLLTVMIEGKSSE